LATCFGSSDAAEDPIFLRLGLTDSVLLQEAFSTHVLLTADLDLYLEAARRGRNAINFTHYIKANQPAADSVRADQSEWDAVPRLSKTGLHTCHEPPKRTAGAGVVQW
jgi:hypothetical protein